MRSHTRCTPGATLRVAVGAAMAVAGCAATHTTAGSVTVVSATPRERAVADAAAILKAFAVPPDARRLQQAPGALKTPMTTLVSAAFIPRVLKLAGLHWTVP